MIFSCVKKYVATFILQKWLKCVLDSLMLGKLKFHNLILSKSLALFFLDPPIQASTIHSREKITCLCTTNFALPC